MGDIIKPAKSASYSDPPGYSRIIFGGRSLVYPTDMVDIQLRNFQNLHSSSQNGARMEYERDASRQASGIGAFVGAVLPTPAVVAAEYFGVPVVETLKQYTVLATIATTALGLVAGSVIGHYTGRSIARHQIKHSSKVQEKIESDAQAKTIQFIDDLVERS